MPGETPYTNANSAASKSDATAPAGSTTAPRWHSTTRVTIATELRAKSTDTAWPGQATYGPDGIKSFRIFVWELANSL